ncbi:MAG: ATP-binding protein [Syntrophobacteraceae bacterium]|nr:ATP-binding protein [Syntrophobacteraceae bacterium]
MRAKFRTNRFKVMKSLVLAAVLLVGTASWLAISTATYMKDTVRNQFNEQQLALARLAAQRIGVHMDGAIGDLQLMNSLPAIQYFDPVRYQTLLLSILPVFNEASIVTVYRVNSKGERIFSASEQGIVTGNLGPAQKESADYLGWAKEPANRGKILGTGLHLKEGAKDRGDLVFDLIVPTYDNASDAAHLSPTGAFAGYIRLTVDASYMIAEIMPEIRSGKTGYAWAIDSHGRFIWHPHKPFIGQSAFDARHNRNPHLFFARIDQIQRDKMMQGKEGTGSYISGWHRGIAGPMEKLIAFAPVHIEGPFMNYLWSIAVAAPVDEVESMVYSVYMRQFLLQALVVFVIGLCCLFFVVYERRWSVLLEHEVEVKTQDIRKYADELQSSEAKYRSLVENAEDVICTIHPNGLIRKANLHLSRILGVDAGDLSGQTLYRFLPADQVDDILSCIREVLASGKGKETEARLNLPAGNFWFDFKYIPITAEESEEYVLAIGRDITESKEIEQQLINTEKLASLGTMAAGVAHEINNPIGIMLGFCDLLLEKMDPGSMEYNDLKTIERHGLHCKSIVERLLSFARMRDEQEECSDLNTSIESIVSIVKHNLEINRVELALSLAPDLPFVCADSTGLQQVFLNLINNALQAMDGEGLLKIQTRSVSGGKMVEALISDTGCGIRKEHRDKIFDPFFTTKKVGQGTGLGLSVSYGIITRCGGQIKCRSITEEDAPGESGTTFEIVLPACD